VRRLQLLALAISFFCASNLLADLGTKGLFFGSKDPLDKLWDKYYGAATSVAVADPSQGLDVEAAFRQPREQVELKEVTTDTITSLRLLGHANVPIKVLMVCTSTTRDEVQGMFDVIKQINDEADLPKEERLKLQIIASHASVLHGLQISQEDFTANCEVCPYFQTQDIWMQDWGEVGAVMVEGATKERMVVVDTRRGRGLAELPGILAKQWNGHYVMPKSEDGPCGNYGGNIEVTPDDMLVIGDTSTQKLRDFFGQVGYRDDKLCVLETSWLVVGHVDEYTSTLCTPDSEVGYSIVKADPRLAMELLKNVPADQLESRLQGMVESFYKYYAINSSGYGSEDGKVEKVFKLFGHLYEHLNGATNEWTDEAKAFAEFNEQCADVIDRNIETFKAAIKARHGDVPVNVVSFPTLFEQMYGGKACAILPGVVNGVILRDHMVVPDPLFKEYRDHIAKELENLNYKAHFVPNGSYHFLQGQLHCGTNIFRHPNRYVHPRYKATKQSSTFKSLFGDE